MCKFFVVPGKGQALLGMPDIDMFNIININCNTIDKHGNHSTNNYSTNTVFCQSARHVQHYKNMMQDSDRAGKCYANADSMSKFENKDKPTVIDKEPNTINYLSGPDQDNDKRVSAEITQLQRDFKDVFTGIGCFDGMF